MGNGTVEAFASYVLTSFVFRLQSKRADLRVSGFEKNLGNRAVPAFAYYDLTSFDF